MKLTNKQLQDMLASASALKEFGETFQDKYPEGLPEILVLENALQHCTEEEVEYATKEMIDEQVIILRNIIKELES